MASCLLLMKNKSKNVEMHQNWNHFSENLDRQNSILSTSVNHFHLEHATKIRNFSIEVLLAEKNSEVIREKEFVSRENSVFIKTI